MNRAHTIQSRIVSSVRTGTPSDVTQLFEETDGMAGTPPLGAGEMPPNSKDLPSPSEDTNRPNGLILAVDDEAPIRELVQATLERRGYRVILAANGEEALLAYQQYRKDIQLILMDISMPVISGDVNRVQPHGRTVNRRRDPPPGLRGFPAHCRLQNFLLRLFC